jgi:IS30 family transposase
MKEYTQLKFEERVAISSMKQKGMNNVAIAAQLGRHRATIDRELDRNRYNDQIEYMPDIADKKAKQRKHKQIPKIEKNNTIKNYMVTKLRNKWSPDVISGRLLLDFGLKVATETIYQYIYSPLGRALNLASYLATKCKKRNHRHERKSRKIIIPDKTSVHERSDQANKRLEVGHFEGDLTFCTGNRSTNILVITERVSRFSFLMKNSSKNAKEVGKNMFNCLASIPHHMRKSITFDNGTEFVNHRLVRNFLGIKTYFCDPHSPWQKGQVEKTNAMLHRFIPKRASLASVDENSLKQIQNQFNNVPRKVLGYKTPAEIFNQLLENVALQA